MPVGGLVKEGRSDADAVVRGIGIRRGDLGGGRRLCWGWGVKLCRHG